jgi:PAS domain S-box-containing protein
MSCEYDEMDYTNLFDLMWEHSDNLLLLLSEDLAILRINHVAEQLLECNICDVLNKNINLVFQEKRMPSFMFKSKASSEQSTYVLINHQKIKINWTIVPTQEAHNKNTLFFIIGKKEIEPRVDHFEIDQLETVIKFAPGLLYWKDKNSVYLGCNQEFAQLAGLTDRKEVRGKTDFDLIWKERANLYVEIDKAVIDSGVARLNHVEVISVSNNKTITAITNKVPMRDAQGQVIGVLGITTDITYQKEVELALSAAKEAAEAANIAKTEFLANMSHDIRTPLSGVVGLSDLLEHTLSNEVQREQAHLLHDSGEELLRMLNGILDDVRSEHLSDGDIQEEAFDINECIQDLVRLELPTTTLKNLRLAVAIEPDVPRYIVSDRKKIHRILLNLLGNAIKFTQSGCITIELKNLSKDESTVHLQFGVADTGIGISPEVQDKIFDRFFRVTSSYKGLYTGHGLGLHIAQSYVSLLGGHITLTSEEAVGSSFHFDIQCEIAQSLEHEQLSSIHHEPLRPAQQIRVEVPIASAPNEINQNAPHLLLIEDNMMALKVLESLVSAAGLQFTSATTGEQGFELATSRPFDLIVTDIGLPGISGNEFARQLRDWEHHQQKTSIPIVGLTGHAKETARPECISNGMNEVWSKPASLSLVQEIVATFIKPKNSDKSNTPSEAPLLGLDLPASREELFQLEHFALLDAEDALKNCGNNKTILMDMLSLMVEKEVPADLEQLKQAFAAKEYVQVEKTAHKIKGGAVYVGTIRMKMACQYVERYWKSGQHELFEPLYHQAVRVIEETLAFVDEWLKNKLSK